MHRLAHTRFGASLARVVRRHTPAWWPVLLRSPWTVAALVLLLYSLWTADELLSGHDARDFAFVGRAFVLKSHASSVIKLDRHYHYLAGGGGYDGQFAYFIALDPVNARYYLDTGAGPNAAGPDYRYTRIVYPMAARLLAAGQPAAIPYTLILVNLLALAGGTLALALWLRRRGLSPWFATVYGLYPGLFSSLQRDLTEALAFALVALGILLLDMGGRTAVFGAGLAFAAAALTRETTAIFPLVYGAAWLITPGQAKSERGMARQRALLLLGISLLPLVLYKLFLWAWLGALGRTGGLYPTLVPFGGIATYWPWQSDQIEELGAVILPAILCAAVAGWAVRRGARDTALWALLANVLLFVVFLNEKSYVEYFALGRITTGVVLAAVLCLPALDRLTNRDHWWFWTATLFWFSMGPALLQFYRRGTSMGDVVLAAIAVLVLRFMVRHTSPRLPKSDGAIGRGPRVPVPITAPR